MVFAIFFLISIHPPIQGGNVPRSSVVNKIPDPPSHTGRKRRMAEGYVSDQRSTLPYREETQLRGIRDCLDTIHPPIQGGNSGFTSKKIFFIDPPSHTGRKPIVKIFPTFVSRSTLPYREETLNLSNPRTRTTIHPPIQGGNGIRQNARNCSSDPPSHTGRKLRFGTVGIIWQRSTLPYREET